MTPPLRKRHAASALLLAAWALAPGAAPASAQSFQNAACRAFEGSGDCRTVTVVDEDACIVKLRPRPLPELDPAIAGCLIDDIGTRQVFLKNAREADTAVLSDAGAAGETGAKTRVRIAGPGAIQILTRYDGNGAPVWEARDSETFEHEGEAARTRAALETLSSEFCGRPTEAAGASAVPDEPGAGAGAAPRAIGVEEAYRLSKEGRIVLVDVRLESEWRETGIAATAIPITMHQRTEDFVQRLGAKAGADGRAPIALICARGERTARLQRALTAYGLDGIIDVRGGMLGGNGAPGWIEAGLPVKPYVAGPVGAGHTPLNHGPVDGRFAAIPKTR